MKDIIFGDSVVTLTDSLYITAVSMAIVFTILLLISMSLSLLKIFSKFGGVEKENEKKKKNNKLVEEKVKNQIETAKDSYEIENIKYNLNNEGVRLAIITACIHAEEEFGHDNIKINYVREVQ